MSAARSLTARSVIASLLLGLRDPALPASALVRSGGRLGVAEGTVRVALSRMVASGELELVDGRYRLAGELLDRHRRQERGRRPDRRAWDGTWLVVVTGSDGTARPPADRTATRRALAGLRFASWREGVWLRPDNLTVGEPTAWPDDAITLASATFVDPADVGDLVDRLWAPAVWAATARELLADLDAAAPADDLAAAFSTAAAVVRHLRDDPLLPDELLPADWPGDELRAAYDAYEAAFQDALRNTAAAPGAQP